MTIIMKVTYFAVMTDVAVQFAAQGGIKGHNYDDVNKFRYFVTSPQSCPVSLANPALYLLYNDKLER